MKIKPSIENFERYRTTVNDGPEVFRLTLKHLSESQVSAILKVLDVDECMFYDYSDRDSQYKRYISFNVKEEI
jgi:hypothetical protein